MKNCLFHSLFLPILLAFMGSSVEAANTPATKDVSILIYYSGDNRLSDFMHSSYLRVLREGAGPNVNVVVQYDGLQKNDAFRVVIGDEKVNGEYAQTFFEKNTEYDMGKVQTLVDFVSWGRAQFPAKRTFLIISSHGFGILNNPYPEDPSKTKGPIAKLASSIDDTSHSFMAEEEMAQKLKIALKGEKLDLLIHNSCLMGSLESLAIMASIAKFAITSEYSIYMNTNDDLVNDEARTILIERLIKQVKKNPQVSELEIGREVVADFGKNYQSFQAPTDRQEEIRFPSTLAFYDLGLIQPLARLYSNLTQEFKTRAEKDKTIFYRLFDENLKARYVDSFGYIDLRTLYLSLVTALDPQNIAGHMQSFEMLQKKVVPKSVALFTSQTVPVSHLHVFFPSILTQADLSPFRKSYGDIKLVQSYGWPSFLDFFWAGLESHRDAYWIEKLQAWSHGATIILKPTSDASTYDYDLFLELSMMAIRLKKIKGQEALKKYLVFLDTIQRKSADLNDHRSYVRGLIVK